MKSKTDKVREFVSGGLAVCFYILFLIFAWYVAYGMALEFYTGQNVGMPENPKLIADELLEPTMDFVVQLILWIAAYAFFFGNWRSLPAPDRLAPLHRPARHQRDRRDFCEDGSEPPKTPRGLAKLKAVLFPKRAHLWTIPWWLQLLLLLWFSYRIRMGVVDMIGRDTVQILDFDRVFRMSLQEGTILAEVQGINFYRAFPNWALYVKLIHCLNVHFGAVPLTGIMWNVIASCISVGLVYVIVYLGSGRDVLAIISALLFSVNPFYLYYEILLSPDFTFIFLCLSALLILTVAWRMTESLWLQIPAALIFGAVLALSGFFKSIDKILLIALVIVAFLRWIAKGHMTQKGILRCVSVAAACLIAYGGMMNYGYNYIDNYVGGVSNRDVSPYFLNVGLNSESGGQWCPETLELYLGLIDEYDYDFAVVNEKMNDHLKETVEEQNRQVRSGEDPELWRDFMEHKLRKAWGNNEGMRFIMNTIDEENPLAGRAFYDAYLPVVQAFTVATGFLMFLGGIAALLRRERGTVMVAALMVFGFALLLMLSEVQPRYKTVVYPFMAVVSAYGIDTALYLLQLILTAGWRKIQKKAANNFDRGMKSHIEEDTKKERRMIYEKNF